MAPWSFGIIIILFQVKIVYLAKDNLFWVPLSDSILEKEHDPALSSSSSLSSGSEASEPDFVILSTIAKSVPKRFRIQVMRVQADNRGFVLYTTPLPTVVNGTTLPIVEDAVTPDFRIEETPWRPYGPGYGSFKWKEEERPFRMSPFFKQAYYWQAIHEPYKFGCYCTTVYKRLTVLAGCAVLTARHILTTATSTELVLRGRRNDEKLDDILGAWYDITLDVFNSSVYATPARIHYHPLYFRIENINITHPLPVTYDLAIWATTHNLHTNVAYCSRANSGWYWYATTYPQPWDYVHVIGFQYIKSMRKKPLPWFKYATKTRNWLKCPKQEWGWFHCILARLWGKYGIESGAAWHRTGLGKNWMLDGLAAMCSFSLKLRSEDIVHYFTVINSHPVLDWIYDAYMGWLPPEFLDKRFIDSQGTAPRVYNSSIRLSAMHVSPALGKVYDYAQPPYY